MKQALFCVVLLTGNYLFSQIPTYEFITEPVSLMTNYYDYMPGNYCTLPVQIEDNGDLYIVYHARETPASYRRFYYNYIDAFGNVANSATMIPNDVHEGFASIDLDQVTGDPFVAWHGDFDTTSADLEVVMSYDLYHLGGPGLWRSPIIVFDDNTPSPNMP